MSDTYLLTTLAPLGLAWIFVLFMLRVEQPRRLAIFTLGALVVAGALIIVGHADKLRTIESARGESFFNEAWLANARARSMRAVYLLLGLAAIPVLLGVVGLIRKNSGSMVGPLEPAWLANGSWRTRRLFYRWFFAAIMALLAIGVALASEYLNH